MGEIVVLCQVARARMYALLAVSSVRVSVISWLIHQTVVGGGYP